MELKQLEYLIAVAECTSMHRATELLHVSQQNISRTIKQLEEELQISIFSRTSSGCFLTKEGENIYHKAVPIVQAANNLRREYITDTPTKILSGSFQLYFSDQTNNMIDYYTNKFLQQYPEITISAVEENPDEIINLITAPQKQTPAFIMLSMDRLMQQKPLLQKNYSCYLISNEPLRIIMAKTNPYATHSSTSLRKLSQFPFVSLSSSFGKISANMQAILDQNISLNLKYCSNSPASLIRYLKQYNAFSLATKTQFSFQADASSFISIPIKEKIYIAFCFLIPKGHLTPTQQAFYDIFLTSTPSTTQKLF